MTNAVPLYIYSSWSSEEIRPLEAQVRIRWRPGSRRAALAAVLAQAGSVALSLLFVKDAEVIAAAADCLRAYAIDTLLTSLLFCFIGYFNGRGNIAFVMIQGIVGAFLVRIPVSLFMSRLEPVSLFQAGLATPCSTAVQIVLFLGCYAVTSVRNRRDTPSCQVP